MENSKKRVRKNSSKKACLPGLIRLCLAMCSLQVKQNIPFSHFQKNFPVRQQVISKLPFAFVSKMSPCKKLTEILNMIFFVFLRFQAKESVSGVSQVKSSIQRGIKTKLVEQFPPIDDYIAQIFPKKEPLVVVKW